MLQATAGPFNPHFSQHRIAAGTSETWQLDYGRQLESVQWYAVIRKAVVADHVNGWVCAGGWLLASWIVGVDLNAFSGEHRRAMIHVSSSHRCTNSTHRKGGRRPEFT